MPLTLQFLPKKEIISNYSTSSTNSHISTLSHEANIQIIEREPGFKTRNISCMALDLSNTFRSPKPMVMASIEQSEKGNSVTSPSIHLQCNPLHDYLMLQISITCNGLYEINPKENGKFFCCISRSFWLVCGLVSFCFTLTFCFPAFLDLYTLVQYILWNLSIKKKKKSKFLEARDCKHKMTLQILVKHIPVID